MPRHIQRHQDQMIISIPPNSHLLFVNVGEPNTKAKKGHENKICFHTNRLWEDSLHFGFISGGQYDPEYKNIEGKEHLYNRWIDQIKSVKEGDIICAYVTELGFVGIGKCISKPTNIMTLVLNNGRLLSEYANQLYKTYLFKTKVEVNNMGFSRHIPNTYGCEDEYGFSVNWHRSLTRTEVHQTNQNELGKIGITQHVVSDMQSAARGTMINFVQDIFNVQFQFE